MGDTWEDASRFLFLSAESTAHMWATWCTKADLKDVAHYLARSRKIRVPSRGWRQYCLRVCASWIFFLDTQKATRAAVYEHEETKRVEEKGTCRSDFFVVVFLQETFGRPRSLSVKTRC